MNLSENVQNQQLINLKVAKDLVSRVSIASQQRQDDWPDTSPRRQGHVAVLVRLQPLFAVARGVPSYVEDVMRILIVHNRYQQAGGEDTVVANEYALELYKHGKGVRSVVVLDGHWIIAREN